ncbi:MAG: sulfite exporter TauE/SafE family protein [Candidatus Cloacimonetes bacterium]|nr:sulfite exporter TauE/SafE family protein [Candidatus Cloacimonadota bacterium]
MIKTLLEGFFLGISTGSLCLMTCSPIYLPYIMTSDRKLSKSLLAIGEISLGRFVSYLSFGALAGFAGANINAMNRNLFGAIANILLSIYLVLTVVRTHQSEKKCAVPRLAGITRSGLLLGILTGINFCPAFLIALSEAVNLGGVVAGILLFGGFFIGTTLYLIPLAFASLLTQIKKMKSIARILSLIVAAWFIGKGAIGIYEHFQPQENPGGRMIDVIAPKNKIAVISSDVHLPYFKSLSDSVASRIFRDVPVFLQDQELPDSLFVLNYMFLVDDTILLNKALEKKDHILIEPDYDIRFMLDWLQKYTFRTEENFSWEFNTREHEH